MWHCAPVYMNDEYPSYVSEWAMKNLMLAFVIESDSGEMV